jgi:hypothetical protein
MGTFYADIGVGHPLGGDFLPVSALVDTGSTHSVIPESLLASLSLAPLELRTYRIADGSFSFNATSEKHDFALTTESALVRLFLALKGNIYWEQRPWKCLT